MPNPQSQPSSIIFPTSLQQPEYEEQQPAERPEPWGWLEIFVLTQVFWGILLFLPGSQAYRTYIRAFPYMASLVALIACARSNGTDMRVPGSAWIVGAILLLVANLTHQSTWFMSGIAQIIFQTAIAAPVFWGARMWITGPRLERLILLILGANFVSAGLGLLQVYYPATFMPPQFSQMALAMNRDFITDLSYVGAGDRVIIRPPGLSDLPGGAAIAGTLTALLAFAFAMRVDREKFRRAIYFGCAAVGITVVYLTQVRSMLLMILGCALMMALVKLRQGKVVQSGWIASSAGVLMFGAFLWAVTLGGESVQERYQGILDTGVVQSYQDNRGFFLAYTFNELPQEYPLGAGLGRWGMMSLYFGGARNWQYPSLYAEIQLTGWVYDGGLLMLVIYPMALLVAMHHSYKLAVERNGALNDFAAMVLAMQMLIAGLCLTGPVFNTQLGIMFWLATALLYGSQRTLATQELQAELEAAEGDDEAEYPEAEEAGDELDAGEFSPRGARRVRL